MQLKEICYVKSRDHLLSDYHPPNLKQNTTTKFKSITREIVDTSPKTEAIVRAKIILSLETNSFTKSYGEETFTPLTHG